MPNEIRLESKVFDLLSQASEKMYIYLADFYTDRSRWSRNAVEYFGLPGEYMEHTAQTWANYIHPDDRHIFWEDMDCLVAGTSSHHNCEYRARNAAGEYVWVQCKGLVERKADGTPGMFAGTMVNLGTASKFDSVTGLFATPELGKQLQTLLSQGQRGALLLLGVDRFRRINDVWGYSTGDTVLQHLARQLMELPGVTAFRMDGDEAACLIPDADRAGVCRIFEQVQTIAQGIPAALELDIHVTISAGAVWYPEHGDCAETLRASAEYALEQAKKAQRGGMSIYSDDLHQAAMDRFQLQEALQEAIHNDFAGFSLCYQPLICSDTERVFGAEALLRFTHRTLGCISPARFIPILEEDGSINEVGTWVLRTALTQTALWRKTQPDFCISVNTSYIQMCQPGFRGIVLQEVERSGLPPESLVLELTESREIRNPQQLKADFDFFRSHRIGTALDDFGTGYASIAMLRELMPPWIKIDHTFVASITDNKLDQAILEYVLQLCKTAGISVCVEGVETAEILHLVRRYQPELLQGYYFAKPLSAEAFQQAYIQV